MSDIGAPLTDPRHRAKARDKFEEAGASAKDVYNSLKSGAEELYTGGQEHFLDSLQLIGAKVRERPVLAVAAAAGVGLLLGLLLRGPRTVYVRVPTTAKP